jgi:ribosomal protein S18 acetylase RimI-like enzyme
MEITDFTSSNTTLIEKASKNDADIAAVLTLMAYEDFVYEMFGGNENRVLDYFKRLWTMEENRFSYQYSYIATINSKPVGLLTCYPGKLCKKLVSPTIWNVVRMGKIHFLWHILTHIKYFYHFANTTEAYPDEFYIGTLAVLPEYRNHGVGEGLIDHMRIIAEADGLFKCSLLVEGNNTDGIRFYERNGFEKVLYSENPRSYFRVVNIFNQKAGV